MRQIAWIPWPSSGVLKLDRQEDATRHTIPTYRVLRPLVRRIAADPDGAEQVIKRVEFTTRIGLLRYLIMSFRLQQGHAV